MTEFNKQVRNSGLPTPGQTEASDAPSGPQNADKMTNSGYPSGGNQAVDGRDEYGRDESERKLAGLPPLHSETVEPSDDAEQDMKTGS